MAAEHPELAVTYMKAMIKVGRWSNEHRRAAAAILNRQTVYLDAEDTYQAIKHVDMVPSLCAKNMQAVDICKEFMLKHGYIKNDFDVNEWAAPELLEQAATEVLKGGVGKKELDQASRRRRTRGRRHTTRIVDRELRWDLSGD